MLAYSSSLLCVEFARSQFRPITTDGFAEHAKFKIDPSFVSHSRIATGRAMELIRNKRIFDRLESNTTSVGLTGFKLAANRSMNTQRYVRQLPAQRWGNLHPS
jgi:hypothetical protein